MKTDTDAVTGRFELLIQSISDYAIYMLDLDGRVTSWNPGAERFKGYAADEIMGQHFSRFYSEEDRAANIPATALKTAREAGRFETEGWRIRKDGSRFWANVVIDPVRDEGGTLIGYAKITRDLTSRKEAQEELRRSEERFRLLVQSVTDYAIYMLDAEGHVASWNPGAERFKGYTADEIIGQHFSRFYSDEDRAAGIPEIALKTAREAGRFEAEGWRIRKDGSRFWANVVIDPVRGEGGELIGFAKITRDLTERREAQIALEEAQQTFFQSQKMEAIGKLTGGVAHDFNNLLAAIVGSIDLAKRRLETGGDIGRFLDNAMQAAQRGATLTQRMLAFARKQDLQLETVDIGSLVRGMADLLERTIGPDVRIETQFPLSLRPVRADPAQLELALMNLAVNARDAMPHGGSIIFAARYEQIHDSRDLAPGDYVCLSVVDEGEGMDADTLAKAADPFFTTKGVGKGTGLGLSMVVGMAEQCGGKLLLRSAPGKGTTCDLWLPAAAANSDDQEEKDAEPAEPEIASLTILAVDDDHVVLLNTAAMLADLGHTVLQASSGQQALDVLQDNRVDLVLTDFAMPSMTGAQLAEKIGAQQPETKVIIMSGYAELPEGVAGRYPRLAKPFRQDQLAHCLASLFAQGTDAEARRLRHRGQ